MRQARNDISEKNPYYLSKDRYLELKHFCYQYPEWEREYRDISIRSESILKATKGPFLSDVTGDLAVRKEDLSRKMELVKRCCKLADESLADYIFQSVAYAKPYVYLKAYKDVPCSRDTYYKCYRRFYYILSQKLQNV